MKQLMVINRAMGFMAKVYDCSEDYHPEFIVKLFDENKRELGSMRYHAESLQEAREYAHNLLNQLCESV